MADDDKGLVPLEDETPAPIQVEEEEPDGVVVNPQGEKLVPLAALHAERTKAKEAGRLRHENEQLKQRAARADELEGWVTQARPYVDGLRNRPDLLEQLQRPKAAPDAAQVPDEVAERLARTAELYTPEGRPDIERGRMIASTVRQLAKEEAQAMVAPAMRLTAQQTSTQWFRQALQVKDQQGRTVSEAALREAWGTVPAELIVQDPQIAVTLLRVARGIDAETAKAAPVLPESEPIFTEPSGGQRQSGALPANLLTRAARRLDVSEKSLAQTMNKFKPGQANVLE